MHANPAPQHPLPLIPAPAVQSVSPWAEQPLGTGETRAGTEVEAETVVEGPMHNPDEAQSYP